MATYEHPLFIRRLRGLTLAAFVAGLIACGGQSVQESPPPAPPPESRAEVDSDARSSTEAEPETVTVTGNRQVAREVAKLSADMAYGFSSGAHAIAPATVPVDRENYAHLEENGVRVTRDNPVSTFSIDVDTGAYSNVRRILNAGQLPPADAVRVEELINYFSYGYEAPPRGGQPFSVMTEVSPTPWNPDTLLLHIGIKGFEVPADERPASNLVFLMDVSGSMNSPDKLPLLKNAFRLLTQNLDARDRVSIVVYAGASGLVLEPTPGNERATILAALDRLQAGGSTNGGAGIRLAYSVAREAFIEGGINRVLLATDGDFNVGTVNFESLVDIVERERESGVSLTTLGFGTGNYNDHLTEQLADAGNGNHAYIDTLSEARKVLVSEMGATLQTIASDVKIQVDFNPAQVAEYRLIGYENRALNREDFNNDKVDAGEIGAGHTVTAIYELTPVGSPARLVDDSRYASELSEADPRGEELAFLRLRYKAPQSERSTLIEVPIARAQTVARSDASESFRFAAAVAAFGQQLRGGRYLGDYTLDDTAALAQSATGADPHGYRREFVSLVSLARSLSDDGRIQISDRGPDGG